MRFGKVPVSAARGSILAHSLATPKGLIKKGRTLTADDVDALAAAGFAEVTVATLEADDIGEDQAAARIARSLAGAGTSLAQSFTGRANLYAAVSGIARLDAARITQLNEIDEGLTVATVAPFERVAAGQMIATVKIIPFALPTSVVSAGIAAGAGAVAVAAFQAKSAGLILTALPATKASVLEKRARVMGDRLAALGTRLAATERVAHDSGAVAAAIRQMAARGLDPILLFSASAIVDRGDVIPAGLEAAGGTVLQVGMPVDPGNLLMLGQLGGADVIGVPSCAASPKLNGFDWVLERRIAGLEVGRREIAAMGLGGLLKEIPTRPQPRDEQPADEIRRAPRLAAVVLAAGRSTRMGAGRNKLLEVVEGKPLVRYAVEAAIGAGCSPVIVVTGHRSDEVRDALAGLAADTIYNARFADGLSTSLLAGIHALPASVDGAFVLLGDMPGITAGDLGRLAAAFAPKEQRAIVVPVRGGKRGNPVLWGRQLFPSMDHLSGDSGARQLLIENADAVAEVEIDSDAIFLDVDTTEALAQLASSSISIRN